MTQNFTLRHVVSCYDMQSIFIARKITVMKFQESLYQDSVL